MKEKIVLGIFVFSVLMILVLGFFLIRGNITGKSIQENEEEASEKSASCIDSDGMNYNTPGKADYCDENGCSSQEDFCSGNKVIEWYCQDNQLKNEGYECEFECEYGMCLKVAKEYKLIGTGGGGGGSGGVSPAPAPASTGQTYSLGELASEQILEIVKNDNIQFSISGVGHLLALQDNSETLAIINIDGRIIPLSVGNEINLDLNNDSVPELYIKLNSINIITNKAKLILNLVS